MGEVRHRLTTLYTARCRLAQHMFELRNKPRVGCQTRRTRPCRHRGAHRAGL